MFNARPGEDLLLHLRLVGELAGYYGKEFGNENIGHVLGLLHDTGKATAKFQKVLNKDLTLVDHAEVSSQVLFSLYERGEVKFKDERILYIMMNILAGHHSKFWDAYADPEFIKEKGGIFSLPVSFENRNVTHDGLRENALSSFDEFERVLNYVRDNNLFLKIELSAGFDLDKMNEASRMLYCRILFSCLVDADYTCASYATSHLGYKDDDIPMIAKDLSCDHIIADEGLLEKLDTMHEELELSRYASRPINVLRNRVYKDASSAGKASSPGLYTMTAPTGMGKTFALMKFALEQAKVNRQKRVIVVLPYLSIIQQNTQKYKEIFGDDIVIEADSSVKNDSRNRELADRWDAPIIVTTTVTFFETLMSGTAPKLRKLHRLINSVIVFDESQTLDNKLLSVTIRTLEALGKYFNTTVLLSTATQPAYNERKDLHADITEIINDVPGLYKEYGLLKDTKTEFIVNDTSFTYEILAERFKEDKETLYIVNTTKKAWELYLSVNQIHPGDTYMLTGLQTPGDKKRIIGIINELLQNRKKGQGKPVHLVSTQCIEAGVDIDFIKGCREYAPLTSIIQSAGRINRECRDHGYMLIFSLENKSAPGQSYINEMNQSYRMAKRQCGELNINDTTVIMKYYKALYSGTEGYDRGYSRSGEFIEDTVCYAEYDEDLRMMDECYKIIDDEGERATVIVPSISDLTTYKELYEKYRNNGYKMDKKDMVAAHDISVSVTGKEKVRFVREHCMPLTYKNEDTGWYISGNDIYDSNTGLKVY